LARPEGRRRRAAFTLLAVAWGAIGCSTTYRPRSTGRVGLVVQHGGAMWEKDGRQVPIGPLGGDLEGLVSDVPVAAATAHRSRRQLTVGVPVYAGGIGVVVTGLALSGPLGWALLGLGAAAAATGLCVIGAGFTNAVDAVNIHNDVTAARPAVAPGPTR
jgi:hypothetical protein